MYSHVLFYQNLAKYDKKFSQGSEGSEGSIGKRI
jgi:hypothetical protein